MVNLRKSFGQAKRHGKIAYVYFKHDDPQPLSEIFGSILKQILQDEEFLPQSIVDFYSSCQTRGAAIPTPHSLADLLHEQSKVEPVYIVIDAIDEADVEVQQSLIGFLKPKFSKKGSSVSLILNDDDQLRGDIENRISENCDGMFLLASLQVTQLVQASRERSLTVNRFRERLKNLPPGTDGVNSHYDTILERIKTQTDADADLALEVLAWVVLSQRTLRVKELLHALAWRPEHRGIDTGDLVREDAVRDLCGGLVVVSQGNIHLVHKTTHDYFGDKSRESLFAGFHARIAYVCAGYLCMKDLEDTMVVERRNWANTTICKDQAYKSLLSRSGTADMASIPASNRVQLPRAASGNTVEIRGRGRCDSLTGRVMSCPFARYAAAYLGYHLGKSRCSRIPGTEDFVVSLLTESPKMTFFGRLLYRMELMQPMSQIDFRKHHYGPHKPLGRLRAIEAAESHYASDEDRPSGSEPTQSDDEASLSDVDEDQIDHFLAYVLQILGFDVESPSTNHGANIDLWATSSSEDEHDLWATLSSEDEQDFVMMEYGPYREGYDAHSSLSMLSNTTPLHLAARIGDVSVLDRVLVESSFHLNATDEFGRSPIEVALHNDNFDFLGGCLQRGALVNLASVDGQRIFLRLAKGDHTELVQSVIRQNQRLIDIRRPGSISPLETVVKLPMLLGCLALAPLRYASTRISRVLRHSDGQIGVMALYQRLDSDNIMAAAERGDASAIARMIEANCYVQDSQLWMVAAFLAVESGNLETVNALIQGGAVDVNVRDHDGDTLLHRAVCRGNLSMVEVLVARGADVKMRDGNGETAWGANLHPEKQQILDFLSASGGADPFATRANGEPLLYCHAAGGDLDTVQFLLRNRINPSATTTCGWAPLHWAASNGHPDCVTALLEHGADHSPVSDTGRTPLDMAIGEGQDCVVQILKAFGATQATSNRDDGDSSDDDAFSSDHDEFRTAPPTETFTDDVEVSLLEPFLRNVIERLEQKDFVPPVAKKRILLFLFRDIREVVKSMDGYAPRVSEALSEQWSDIVAEVQQSDSVVRMLSYEDKSEDEGETGESENEDETNVPEHGD
ncbi:unnamed protein product [Discula destructiva]